MRDDLDSPRELPYIHTKGKAVFCFVLLGIEATFPWIRNRVRTKVVLTVRCSDVDIYIFSVADDKCLRCFVSGRARQIFLNWHENLPLKRRWWYWERTIVWFHSSTTEGTPAK